MNISLAGNPANTLGLRGGPPVALQPQRPFDPAQQQMMVGGSPSSGDPGLDQLLGTANIVNQQHSAFNQGMTGQNGALNPASQLLMNSVYGMPRLVVPPGQMPLTADNLRNAGMAGIAIAPPRGVAQFAAQGLGMPMTSFPVPGVQSGRGPLAGPPLIGPVPVPARGSNHVMDVVKAILMTVIPKLISEMSKGTSAEPLAPAPTSTPPPPPPSSRLLANLAIGDMAI